LRAASAGIRVPAAGGTVDGLGPAAYKGAAAPA
jgi:hypothetical protein